MVSTSGRSSRHRPVGQLGVVVGPPCAEGHAMRSSGASPPPMPSHSANSVPTSATANGTAAVSATSFSSASRASMRSAVAMRSPPWFST